MFMLRTACVVALMSLASCKGDRPREEAPAVAAKPIVPVASESVAPSASAAPAEERPVAAIGIVTYNKGILDECADFAFFGDDKNGILSKVKEWTDAQKKKNPDATLIYKPCREALADRDELATCTSKLTPKADAGPTVRIEAREGYYNLSVLDASDTYMKNCLELGGDWKALPADSPVVKRARAKGILKQANKVLDPKGE